MPKKKTPAEKPEEQFKRFQETAKKVGVDEGGTKADDAFARLVRPQKKSTNK